MEEVFEKSNDLLQALERRQRGGWGRGLRRGAQCAHEDLCGLGNDTRAALDRHVCDLVYWVLWRDVVEVGCCSVAHTHVEDPWSSRTHMG